MPGGEQSRSCGQHDLQLNILRPTETEHTHHSGLSGGTVGRRIFPRAKMARSRNIKPGFYQNDLLAECSVWARLMFPGLWMLADREGRMEDRPVKIKAQLFPFDTQNVDKLLTELHNKGFVIRYEVSGHKYLQVINFCKHQNPHCKEPASTIPAPDLSSLHVGLTPDQSGTSPMQEQCAHRTSPADSLLLIPDPGLLIPSIAPDPDWWGKGKIRFDPSKGEWHGIEDAQRIIWARACPAVDIDADLAKAAAWCVANPQKGRKSNYTSFLTGWIQRNQDRGGNLFATNGRQSGTVADSDAEMSLRAKAALDAVRERNSSNG